MKGTVSSKGQITLPVAVRRQLGLAAGTPLEFELRKDGVFLRKGTRGAHPVDQVYGRLKLSKPVDESLDELRGPRPARPRPWRPRQGRRR
jgi:AbrB family looped-hinge helix DNA binding protein